MSNVAALTSANVFYQTCCEIENTYKERSVLIWNDYCPDTER